MKHLVMAALLGAAALLGPPPVAAADAAPAATIAQGRLAGARDASVERFLDIPFAAAPVGALRWRAPQAPPRWEGVRDAAKPGPACPQTVRPALVAGGVAEYQSEDCLQLNIWRPAGARKLPVMVWIHGGAHVIGSGTFPAFDGTAFARQGVILVTINYRLGALGYFAHPALSAARPHGEALANYGLMDQLAALRWVQNNIAAFGGDPEQVTLFDESAGAIGVTTILAQPEAKGLFARAIVQSGVGLLDPRPLREQEALGAALAARAGAPPSASLEALRALPAAALVAAGDVRTPGAMTGPIFVPASAGNWEYALGSFVECDTPSACATSKINSSPGAYGWTGWIDRETGYYALIATEISSGGDRKGVELEQVMQDLIEEAIASRIPAP